MTSKKETPGIIATPTGGSPGYDDRVIDELRRRTEEQQRRSDRLEEVILQLADARTVDSSLIKSFDHLAEQLEPLQELRGLAVRRQSPPYPVPFYYQAMQAALEGVSFSHLSAVQADTAPVTFIGAVPSTHCAADGSTFQESAK